MCAWPEPLLLSSLSSSRDIPWWLEHFSRYVIKFFSIIPLGTATYDPFLYYIFGSYALSYKHILPGASSYIATIILSFIGLVPMGRIGNFIEIVTSVIEPMSGLKLL